MALADCIKNIKERYPDIDEKGLESVGQDLAQIQETFANNPTALNKALKDYLDSAQLQAYTIVEQSLQNSIKQQKLNDYVTGDQFVAGKEGKGLLAKVVGIVGPYEGGKVSASIIAEKNIDLSQSKLFNDLKKTDSLEYVKDSNNVADIYNQLKKLGTEKEKYKPHPNAKLEGAVQAFKKHGDGLWKMARDSGIDIPYRADWVTRQSFDTTMMYGKRTEWIKDGMKYFNIDEMFPNYKDPNQIMKALGEIYDGILELHGNYITDTTLGKKRDIATRIKLARSIEYKDGSSYVNMQDKYNTTSNILHQSLKTGNMYARKAAVTEIFGTQPIVTFENAAQAIQAKHPGLNISADINHARKGLDILLNGERRPEGYIGKGISATKQVLNMAYLQGMFIAGGLGDFFSSTSANMMKTGALTPLNAAFKSFGTFLETATNKKEILKRAERINFVEISALNREMTDNNGVTKLEKTLTFMEKFLSKFTFNDWQFQTAKATAVLTFSKDMATLAKNNTFADISKIMQTDMKKHNIGEEHFKFLKMTPLDDGNFYISNIDKIPLEKFKDNPDGSHPVVYRDKIKMDFEVYQSSTIDSNVPVGGTREKAIFHANPDSVLGWIGAAISQLKGAVTKQLHNLADHQLSGSDAKTAGALMQDPRVYVRVGTLLTMSAGLGYINMSIKALMKGDEPPEINDDTLRKAMIAGGVTGYWGDLLLGEYEKVYRNPIADIAGPVPGKAAEVLRIVAKLRAGKEISSDSWKLLWTALPMHSQWLFKTLDEGFEIGGEGNAFEDMGLIKKRNK